MRFSRHADVGTLFAIYPSKASFPFAWRTVMKLEALLLKALFSACLLICVLTLGEMLTSKAPVAAIAQSPAVAAVSSAS
jgi:hypothetical protein